MVFVDYVFHRLFDVEIFFQCNNLCFLSLVTVATDSQQMLVHMDSNNKVHMDNL